MLRHSTQRAQQDPRPETGIDRSDRRNTDVTEETAASTKALRLNQATAVNAEKNKGRRAQALMSDARCGVRTHDIAPR